MTSSLRLLVAAAAALLAGVAGAQINSFSDGSDGALNTGDAHTVDLSLAPSAAWNTPAPTTGRGVYDAAKWAVVYKYSSVTVGGNLYFKANRTNAPVIWLVQGDVTINGTIHLEGGGPRDDGGYVAGGPGGFAGGRSALAGSASGSGRGPGGGDRPSGVNQMSGGSYATAGTGIYPGAIYGSEKIIPLIGGSGSSTDGGSGCGGGGAILIVASGTIRINGRITAHGGYLGPDYSPSRGGSGGAIRLVGNTVTGGGSLDCNGAGGGGLGRIRLESRVAGQYTGGASPLPSYATPGVDAQIFPDADAPSVQVTSIGGQGVGGDPAANLLDPDVELSSESNVEFLLETLNVPANWKVRVRVTPQSGDTIYADATVVQQNGQAARWRAVVPTMPRARFTVIAKAYAQ